MIKLIDVTREEMISSIDSLEPNLLETEFLISRFISNKTYKVKSHNIEYILRIQIYVVSITSCRDALDVEIAQQRLNERSHAILEE